MPTKLYFYIGYNYFMAFTARSIRSFKGILQYFKSSEILSREQSIKLSPFFDDDFQLVYWVRASFDEIRRRKKNSYFRHFPKQIINLNKQLDELQKDKIKDNRHKMVQNYLYEILNEKLIKNEKIVWAYKDNNYSDFYFQGDLLKCVETIEKEYRLEIPPLDYYSPDNNKHTYIFDIALLGKVIGKKRIILGAVEIENTHKSGIEKILICKTLGFPLITIDITEIDKDNINKELCIKLLIEKTNTSDDFRRRNFVNIHNLLLPVYIKVPDGYSINNRHQYIVFFKDKNQRDKLYKYINILKNKLNINDQEIVPMNVNINEKSNKMQENEMALIKDSLDEYNTNNYFRITLPRDCNNEAIYLFHLVLTNLLAMHFDCLVGFKFVSYAEKIQDSNKIIIGKFNREKAMWEKSIYCPSELSEPIYMIINAIKKYNETNSKK
jgi:hypothetical protein